MYTHIDTPPLPHMHTNRQNIKSNHALQHTQCGASRISDFVLPHCPACLDHFSPVGSVALSSRSPPQHLSLSSLTPKLPRNGLLCYLLSISSPHPSLIPQKHQVQRREKSELSSQGSLVLASSDPHSYSPIRMFSAPFIGDVGHNLQSLLLWRKPTDSLDLSM